jgi:hypothetical protein
MRTKFSDDINENQLMQINQKLQVLSDLTGRANLSSRLGQQQYGGDRDIYQALGYKKTLSFSDFYERYIRQDIAKAIINRPVEATWRGDLSIIETNDDLETPIEKEWKKLAKDLKLKNKFSRIDKLTGIGRYGTLLLGLNDVKDAEGWKEPVRLGKRKLLYVKPLTEINSEVHSYERNTNSPRFGLPLFYKVEISNHSDTSTVGTATQGAEFSLLVHESRIIHILDEQLESEVFGVPRLEALFNRLMDMEKIMGADAEMFWRGARPGYQAKVDKDYTMTTTAKEDLKAQIDEYEHNLRRMLVTEGITYEELKQAIEDPKSHVEIQLLMISAVTGIPKRILVGTERGELSSAQDRVEMNEYIGTRRTEFAIPNIIEPFVERCITYGILPKPKEKFSVNWPPILTLSEKEIAEIGKIKSTAIKEYTQSPIAESILPRRAFYKLLLGMTDEEIELVEEQLQAAILAEPTISAEEQALLDAENTPVRRSARQV